MPRNLQPTPAQLLALAAYAMTGNHQEAADLTGKARETHRRHVAFALERLNARDCFEAFRVRGWLVIPAELLDALGLTSGPPQEMTA